MDSASQDQRQGTVNDPPGRTTESVSAEEAAANGCPALAPFVLNDGEELPAVGFGSFGMRGEIGIATIVEAIRNGYRLIDTAEGYGNEQEVGEAVRRSGVPRDDLRVTTKINGHGHGYDAARRSIEESRRRIGVDRIDLHLIHWPTPSLGKYVDTWRALVAARADGEIRSIGVSNFTRRYLDPIIEATGVVPAVNQVELHPHFPQDEQRSLDQAHGILTQAWSPLGRGSSLFQLPAVADPARRLGVSPAQVVLRWEHQLGTLPIPRSTSSARQRENLDLAAFQLTDDEVGTISALGRRGGRLWNGDPDVIAFM